VRNAALFITSVILEAEENPHHSTRQLALNHNMNHSFVVKLFKKEKYHSYKIQLTHELNEDDPDRRVQFCEELMLRCDEDPNFLNNILFSDEATFCTNGTVVHRHNCRVLVKRKSSLDSRLSQSTPREIKYMDWNNRTAFNRALLF
jgi:hypothetical protein